MEMKQGRASRENPYRKYEPRTHAIVPAVIAQIGQAQGNHVTNRGSTGYGGVDMMAGKGYEPPKGPSQRSGIGGGRDIHHSGSQGRR
jgi:hypothetical protein